MKVNISFRAVTNSINSFLPSILKAIKSMSKMKSSEKKDKTQDVDETKEEKNDDVDDDDDDAEDSDGESVSSLWKSISMEQLYGWTIIKHEKFAGSSWIHLAPKWEEENSHWFQIRQGKLPDITVLTLTKTATDAKERLVSPLIIFQYIQEMDGPELVMTRFRNPSDPRVAPMNTDQLKAWNNRPEELIKKVKRPTRMFMFFVTSQLGGDNVPGAMELRRRWEAMSKEERERFRKMADNDRLRYETECRAIRAMDKLQSSSSSTSSSLSATKTRSKRRKH